MIKKFTAIVLSISLLSILAACGNSVSSTKDTASVVSKTQTAKEEPADEAAGEFGEEKAVDHKILVAYFSCTGTTESLAGYAADILGADIYEIVPEEPYTDADLAYYTGGRADKEQEDPDVRPGISGSVSEMAAYDTIVLGYPIWHGQAPRIISTFLESYDFAGKTIVPFCTSHSSGVGSSADHLHPLCADSTEWKEGMRFGGGTSKETMEEWLVNAGVE